MRYLLILLGTAVLAGCGTLLIGFALAPAPIPAEYWVRGMLVVKRNLAESVDGKARIIIAGGSSTMFGIDSVQMERTLDVPVVNFGLHAGLPLKTILDETERIVKSGDVLLLALEPPYYKGVKMTPWQARTALAWDHERWAAMSWKDRVAAFWLLGPDVVVELAEARFEETFLPQSLSQRMEALDDTHTLTTFLNAPKPTEFSYSAFNLDDHGNMRFTDGCQLKHGSTYSPLDALVDHESWDMLRLWVDRIKSKRILVYLTPTPSADTPGLNLEKVDEASAQFASTMAPIAQVLGSRRQAIFPQRLFFDTGFHLNSEGRRIHTDRLIDSIRKNPALMAWIREHQKVPETHPTN